MTNALKIIITFLVLTTGCTVFTEASYFRCYYENINNYVEYESKDIAKMMDAQPYFTKYITIFMWVHGFNATMTGPATTTMINSALRKGGWNVCAWNWVEEARASQLLGSTISYGVKGYPEVINVGLEMANSFKEVAYEGFNLDGLHAYAHSMGAHVVGHCGSKLQENGFLIGRIVGLDSAGPVFDIIGDFLSKYDGKCVICIHTDPGNKGTNSSHCHIDVWVNYLKFLLSDKAERVQPNCPENISVTDLSQKGTCSHDLSWKLIAASFFYDFPMSYATDYWTWARSNGTATPVILLGDETVCVNTALQRNFFMSAAGVYPFTLGMDALLPFYY